MVIPVEWLDKKINVVEAEASHPGISDDRVVRFPEAAKPFGFQHDEWEELKAELRSGDELWTFTSPPEFWRQRRGTAGIVLVRDGKIVSTLITEFN